MIASTIRPMLPICLAKDALKALAVWVLVS